MFIAGWNQPGYLPESDPEEFDGFEDACGYIDDEIARTADDAELSGNDDEMKECSNSLNEVSEWKESDGDYWQTYCDGYVYWINRED